MIFAMSVLCRWPETKFLRNSSAVYSFEKFAKTVALLDSCLAPEGVFVVINSNYLFRDRDVLDNYTVVSTPELRKITYWMPKFTADNQRVDRFRELGSEFVFLKGGVSR